ncbi:amidohydrolase family protein [Amycolatopsis rhabdoformis]|uniref:6-methylsalicylate decarboxylase n=1 Tax=Amycolatopsis rhabdoformis TaxID=1448059 RepID=A0ABZ1HXT1_9PSEU|nr:amidohydrolase family protein [Amycolatopsis rhabdoformis]WSE26194.1 amidohydrolase family protein [Amycolatopsis rhabdoformis]
MSDPQQHPGRFDVHHHALPRPYQKALDSSGAPQLKGVDPIHWDVDSDREVMRDNDIRGALLSVTAPGTTIVPGPEAIRLARDTNEEFARLVADNDGAYGAFALLPLPDATAAIAEIDHAVDELGLDGVGLFSNSAGVYLGDEQLEPVLAHLAEREITAFVHPAIPASTDQATFGLPPSLYEFTFDTTRAVANLLYSGTLDRHPGLKLVLSHAGGTVPFLAQRLTYAATIASRLKDREPADLLGSLRRLYYDTAMSANRATLAALTELVGPEHILFGSDYPYMPASTTRETVEGVVEFFSPADRELLERRNFEVLFPRFCARAKTFAAR